MQIQNIAVPVTSAINNPASGVFGTGQVQFFTNSGSWTIPPGIGKVRARCFGAGGGYNNISSYYSGGGGGGFAIKTIYGLDGLTSIPITVGIGGGTVSTSTALYSSGTSSFGSFVSATGGYFGYYGSAPLPGGSGVGGDINNIGGTGGFASSTTEGGGGGCASIFGSGGNGGAGGVSGSPSSGGAGGGSGFQSGSVGSGGNGFLGVGAIYVSSTVQFASTSGLNQFSIDFLGTGGGAMYLQPPQNGGGGSYSTPGAFPGGGSGVGSPSFGANGLVIVEW